MTSLAGNTGREHTVDQQGTSNTQPNRTMDAQRQRPDRTGSSSTFSNSFTSTTSSLGASSNSRPSSSSSSVSFRINTSGNPWHARRLSASGGTSPGNNEGTVKRNEKSKKTLLSLKSGSKEVKREVYDPFDPTGSDSSDSEPENKGFDFRTKSRIPAGPNEGACRQIKSEPMDVDPERGSPVVLQSDMGQIQTTSRDHVVDSSSSDARMDVYHDGTQESPNKNSEDLSESSLTCGVKTQVKSEPEDGPPPNNPQSTSPKKRISVNPGNGDCKELPGVSAPSKEEKTSHKSQSRRRSPSSSPSPSKDTHKKKHSRSKDKRRSRSNSRHRWHSKLKERQRSRSRSRDRKYRRSSDRRSSSSSSSRERKQSRKSREKSDSRGRERRRKRMNEKRRSRSRSLSRSRSRSRERRMTSKDLGERSKRHKSRSRSTSRERRKREDRTESDRRREKNKNTTESAVNKTSTSSKRESRAHESKNTFLLPSVKQEVQSVGIPNPDVGSSSHDDQNKPVTEDKKDKSPDSSKELKMFKVEEIKQEKLSSVGEVGKDIKKEEELNAREESESDTVNQEMFSSPDVFNEKSPEPSEINLDDFGKTQDDETKVKEETNIGPKNVKIEQIWPDEEDSPCCSDNPLVISLDTPDVDSENCIKENMDLSPLMDDMEVTSEDPIKQEPVDMSDDDINVDYLIDNLDFIKKEMSESFAADSTDAVDLKSAAEETQCENKTITESVTAGVKSKSQGKRVTWNLQESEAPSSEKLSSEYMTFIRINVF